MADQKILRRTSRGSVVIEPYVDDTYVVVFDDDGWSVRDGPHGGELWEALFYVTGIDEQEAKAIQEDIHSDKRYVAQPSGAKRITAVALIGVAIAAVLICLGLVFLFQLVF